MKAEQRESTIHGTDAENAYAKSLAKYYWGVTPIEIQADKIFPDQLLGKIKSFGGYTEPIDRKKKVLTETIPIKVETIDEKIKSLSGERPEFAAVLDSAITLQQDVFVKGKDNPTDAVQEALIKPINASRLGWSAEESAAIKQTGYSLIDEIARNDSEFSQEIEIFSNNFRALVRRVSQREPIPSNQKRATRETRLKLDKLRLIYAALPEDIDISGGKEIETNAAISLGKLDKRVQTIHKVPRIARETYVDYLAGALFYRRYPEALYVRVIEGERIKYPMPPMVVQQKKINILHNPHL